MRVCASTGRGCLALGEQVKAHGEVKAWVGYWATAADAPRFTSFKGSSSGTNFVMFSFAIIAVSVFLVLTLEENPADE